ncbi:DUF4242 domain-containing protein [Flavitalea flava]
MKVFLVLILLVAVNLYSSHIFAQTAKTQTAKIDTETGKTVASSNSTAAPKYLYLDVHHLEPGKVTYEGVAMAHAKDLATQHKYGANFLKFWVDEPGGTVYCLVSAADSQSIRKTHGEAHGLMPDQIFLVTGGQDALANNGKDFYLDIHELGAGNVTAKDGAATHQKDLAVQSKYGVNFVNYWVDEKEGRVYCLAQASDSSDIIKAHKEAHGLIPVSIVKVKQGN